MKLRSFGYSEIDLWSALPHYLFFQNCSCGNIFIFLIAFGCMIWGFQPLGSSALFLKIPAAMWCLLVVFKEHFNFNSRNFPMPSTWGFPGITNPLPYSESKWYWKTAANCAAFHGLALQRLAHQPFLCRDTVFLRNHRGSTWVLVCLLHFYWQLVMSFGINV